jgi:hypothetical protein
VSIDTSLPFVVISFTHASIVLLHPFLYSGRAPIIDAFRYKKLSATRNVIFDFHYQAMGLALGESTLLMGKKYKYSISA